MTQKNKFTISIVSHGQGDLIKLLLNDIEKLSDKNFNVIITLNIPEDESPFFGYDFPIRLIRNFSPKGFGHNHNSAFEQSVSDWYIVVNPDIRFHALSLNNLIEPFECSAVAAVAPVVLSSQGLIEDSARKFPTLLAIINRSIFGNRGLDYEFADSPVSVDWVAGMFVVFRSDSFRKIGGFDSRRFFMYMEDADICRRIRQNGWEVVVNTNSKVIHMAQRASRKNLRHMRWHIVSLFRYLSGI